MSPETEVLSETPTLVAAPADNGPETLEDLAGMPLVVAGRTISIKRLSTRQILRILRLAASAYAGLNPAERQNMVRAAQTAEAGAGLNVLVSILDEKQVGELLGIITREDPDWCLDNLGLLEISQVAEKLAQNEQLGEVMAAFRRVAEGWRPQLSS
jgi:hypothetical protein